VDAQVTSSGTALLGMLELGIARSSLRGEAVCGDLEVLGERADGVLVGVVDGIGHGAEARAVAERAVDAALSAHTLSVIPIVRRCHAELLGSRGVVMSLASLSVADDTLTWLAVGNVAGLLMRADPSAVPRTEGIVTRAGIVGCRLPMLNASVTCITPGDVLVFATDGIRAGFVKQVNTVQSPQHLADRILSHYGRDNDDALVLVARYRGTAQREG
jgi:serine phosphatase RsbU (regulator of sigma subunit)